MHNVLFVLIWPIAVICSFLSRSRFVAGFSIFAVCQTLLWHTMMNAMSAPNWDESAGDWLLRILIILPVPVFFGLAVVRLLLVTACRLLLKYFPAGE